MRLNVYEVENVYYITKIHNFNASTIWLSLNKSRNKSDFKY